MISQGPHLAAAVAATVFALAAMAATYLRRPGKPRSKCSWFEMTPRSPDVDAARAERAVSMVGRRRRPGRLVTVRRGHGSQQSQVFLGIEGAADASKAAEALAEAAGRQASPLSEGPPLPEAGLRWWRSYPTKLAPTPRSLILLARDPDVIERSGIEQRADEADRALDDGDYLVIEARPDRDYKTVTAAAMTTKESLGQAWTHFADRDLIARRPRPHPAAAVAVVAFVLALGVLAGMTGLVPWRWTPTSAAVAAMAAVLSVAAMRLAVARSPDLRFVESGCRVALPRRHAGRVSAAARQTFRRRGTVAGEAEASRRMVMPLPAAEAAGWLAAGPAAAAAPPDRFAPRALTEAPPAAADGVPQAVRIGEDLDGRPVWIADRDRANAVLAFGDPGYGKTTMLLNVLHGDAERRAAGAGVTLVWIEVKEDAGAVRAGRVMRSAGVEPLTISGASSDGLMLDLIDWSQPLASAQALTSAFRYAFDKGDIYERSRDIIESALAAVIACPADGVKALGYDVGHPNVVREGLALIGGSPVDRPREWVLERVSGTPEADAFRQWMPSKGGWSKHQLQTILSAPITKFTAIASAEGLWEHRSPDGRGRPTTTFADLLRTHTPTVLHLGPPDAGAAYDKIVAQRVASIVMYLLFQSVRRHCDGWQAAGRATAIYCDELRALAGGDENDVDVISEMLDTGRSLGVRAVLATQRPNQVEFRTREALLSSGSKVYFHMEHPEASLEASLDLEERYTAAEIRALPVGHGAARLSRHGQPNAAFTLKPANIEDHIYASAAAEAEPVTSPTEERPTPPPRPITV